MEPCRLLGAHPGHDGGWQAAFGQQRIHQRREALHARQPGADGEDVAGIDLPLPGPGGVVGRDIGDDAVVQRAPHPLHLGGRAEGRVALPEALQADDVLLRHAEILDAGLARGLGALAAIDLREFEAAREGGMGDMDMRPRLQRHLEDRQIRHRLGDRRAGAAMPDGGEVARGLRGLGELHHQLLVLVMDRDHHAGGRDFREGREHGRVVDAREAMRVVFIGGDLEGAGAGFRDAGDILDAARLPDGAVERHVHMGQAVHPFHLLPEDGPAGHGLGHVIGHVADGGDAAGGRRHRRSLDPRPAGAAGGVHVPIHQAGHDQLAVMLRDGLGRRWRAFADGGDGLAPDGDIAARHHAVRKHHVAREHEVEGGGV